jgi:hypothetical protein
MPLSKLQFRPGINKEVTNYTGEGGYFECDKIRFRSGMPQKIGGWVVVTPSQFLGTCRSLWNWVTLGADNLIGVGTNLKFYLEKGGGYNDITPIRKTVNPMLGPQPPATGNPFAATAGLATIVVTDVNHGCADGDFVTFSGAVSLGGNITAAILNQEYQIAYISANSYSIQARAVSFISAPGAPVLANASDTGGGGAAVVAAYQIQTGQDTYTAGNGWGASYWSRLAWGSGAPLSVGEQLRLWTQDNFGEDLVFAPRGGQPYYWDATSGVTARGVTLASESTSQGFLGQFVPTQTNQIVASAIQRFVICFGSNSYDSTNANTPFDPMLVRWSDQENPYDWVPAATNQSGEFRLSNGSFILAARNTRQEILIWTDSAIYSMQYLGPPFVWGFTIIQDNITLMGPNAVITVNNITYWMGTDKFYFYDGRVQTLPCSLRSFVYGRLNKDQAWQCNVGYNEEFNEIWWFYPSTGSNVIDSYVIYNIMEQSWYYGTMARTAWLRSGLRDFPFAADYNGRLLYHEASVDDESDGNTALPIVSYIQTSDFDIGDGHNFGFVWRILPDLTFAGSTTANPSVTLTVKPRVNSGTPYGTANNPTVTRTASFPVEEYTGQVYTRIRGRQMAFRIDSTGLGVQWQLGSPRIDIRPDGRR